MLNSFAPRPYAPTGICCPACDHGIDQHGAGCTRSCRCQWTPNDVAYWLLFGGLTAPELRDV